MEFLQEITLELNSNTAYATIGAKQGDDSSRVINVHITQNGEDFNLQEQGISSAYFRFRKPDGKAIVNTVTIDYEKNILKLVFTAQALAAAGRGYADITLLSGSAILSTVSFIVIVMSAPQVVNQITSSNEFGYLNDVVNDATRVIYESEAWAVGTRGGIAVFGNDTFTWEKTSEIIQNVSINTNTFKQKVGEAHGIKRIFTFTYTDGHNWKLLTEFIDGASTTQSTPEIISSVSDYGITLILLSGATEPNVNDTVTVTVEEADDTYHNNAKYYAEQAAESLQAFEDLSISAVPSSSASVEKIEEQGRVTGLVFKLPQGEIGETGPTGPQGVSPTIDVQDYTNGHIVVVTDAAHTSSFIVQDGNSGILRVVYGTTTASEIQEAINDHMLPYAEKDGIYYNYSHDDNGTYHFVYSTANAQLDISVNGSSWSETAIPIQALPSGGTTGQALTKASNADYAVEWSDLHMLPAGGSQLQVLKKINNNDYQVSWSSISASELDNDTYFETMAVGTVIPSTATGSAADLDNYLTPGVYYVYEDSTPSLLTHCPATGNNPFRLEVKCINSSGRINQTIITRANKIFNRTRTTGNVWNSWIEIASVEGLANSNKTIPAGGTSGQVIKKVNSTDYNAGWATLSASELNNDIYFEKMALGISIPSQVDLNDYITPGVYYSPNSTRSGQITNVPSTSAGFRLEIKQLSYTGSFARLIQVITLSTESAPIYIRVAQSMENDAYVWGDWHRIAWKEEVPVIKMGATTPTSATLGVGEIYLKYSG